MTVPNAVTTPLAMGEPVGLAIGSHRWNVSGDDRRVVDLLAERYRLTPTAPHAIAHVVAHITHEPQQPPDPRQPHEPRQPMPSHEPGQPQAGLTDQLVVEPTATGFRLTTDPITIHLDTVEHPHQARIVVTDASMGEELLGFHLWLMVNRMMLIMDRMVVHAAAVEIDGQTVVVCGESGAGKSTLTVALGLAGGTILSEDWLLVDASSPTPTVSGVSPVMRLTADSADHLLAGRLGHAVDSDDGRDKRVFNSDTLFASASGVDRTPDRLFILSVGDDTGPDAGPDAGPEAGPKAGPEAALSPASGLDVTRYLADSAKMTLRFTDRGDYLSFLGVVGTVVSSIPAYHLRRSTDFADLPKLVDLVRNCRETA